MATRRVVLARFVLSSVSIAASVHLMAQTPEHLAFEVASVKQNTSGPQAPARMTNLPPGERISFVNVSVRNLVQVAYAGVAEITGGPDWLGAPGPPRSDTLRFDVNAKAASLSTHEQLVAMLRALLADRFHLRVHTDTRQTDVFALRLVNADGRLGPNIHPASIDCGTLRAAAVDAAARRNACGNTATGIPPWHLRGVAVTQLIGLEGQAGRPIVDKTGLTGPFDFDLNWLPRGFDDAAVDRSRWPNIDFAAPNLFTALQEQLGLKLVPEKDEQSVLVIDHVERPTED